MKPGRNEKWILLETDEELAVSQDALSELRPKHNDFADTLDREAPHEIRFDDALLIMQGLRITLAREALAEDSRSTAQQLLDDYEALTSPERIVQWFTVNRVPRGEAPAEIKEQWIGVPLPVRAYNAQRTGQQLVTGVHATMRMRVAEAKDVISIKTDDAIEALRTAGREEAAEWWKYWRSTLWYEPHVSGNTLVFLRSEGELVPAEATTELKE